MDIIRHTRKKKVLVFIDNAQKRVVTDAKSVKYTLPLINSLKSSRKGKARTAKIARQSHKDSCICKICATLSSPQFIKNTVS